MEFDALLLSRFQFAWVIALHTLLPAFTVGLSCYIATLEVLHWVTGRDVYARLSRFWLRIFAVSFGMGVVSGIVMPFQFGTNWSRFVAATSNVVGGFMAYEVLTAFFLESAFLGVLLFGRTRVPRWAHAMSAVMVALGTLLSSFWILAVNSWMQTPTGYRIVDGRFYPDSMLSVLLSPSFPFRLTHTVTAFLVTTAFVILGVGAHYLLQRRALEESRVMVKMSLFFLTIAVPVQIALGDAHGLNTLEHQPTKLAAMEGLWETGRGVRATLFALPAEDDTPASWLLEVIGKGDKQRYLPISGECVDAFREHGLDRGQDLDAAASVKAPGLPLVAPPVILPTPRAREKFGESVDNEEDGASTASGGGTRCAARAGSRNGRSRNCST